MTSRTRIAAGLSIVSVLCPGGGLLSAGVSGKLKELEEVRSQLELKKKEVESYKRQQAELSRDLSRLKSEEESSERMFSEFRRKRRSAEAKKGELTEKLAALTMAQGKGLSVLSGETAGYARHVRLQFPQYGAADLWEESFRRAAVREKAGYLARLKIFRTQTAQAREEALIKGKELHRRTVEAMAELRSRQDTYQRKQVVYKETSSQMSRTLKEIQELEDSAKALTSLIKTLGHKGRRGAEKGRARMLAAHSLPWPVSGRLVSRFGKERVAELNTWVIHTGIEIAAPQGTPVSPVGEGKIIFAGPFRSYGKVIIVDHGGAVYSIYGRLDRFLGEKGDRVTPSAPIGSVGSAPRQGGGLLYFEVREGSEALDPLTLLRRQ